MAVATPGPVNNVHFMLNVMSQSISRLVYDQCTLLKLCEFIVPSNISTSLTALDLKTLCELGIACQPDPEAYTAADPPASAEHQKRQCKWCERSKKCGTDISTKLKAYP